MRLHILDLDGSIPLQQEVMKLGRPKVVPLETWGPRLRMGCSFGRFRRFEQALSEMTEPETEPVLTLYGSGDFHHVSLALVRRLTQPFNLLVLDNHPDWMRSIPFLHCGTWLNHALRLPLVQRVFHLGGDVDFDNYYRWLAPWRQLRAGKITVLPGIRRFQRGLWRNIGSRPLRQQPEAPIPPGRVEELIEPCRADLARYPLYVSLDKDVMVQQDAVVNWDSGHLRLAEVQSILQVFLTAAGNHLAGVDVVGDWSPVKLQGPLRRILHWTEHPALDVEPLEATAKNEQTNLALLHALKAIPAGPPIGECGSAA